MGKLFLMLLVCVYSPAEAKEKTFMERVFYAPPASSDLTARRRVRHTYTHTRARRTGDEKVVYRTKYECIPSSSTFQFTPVPPVGWQDVSATWTAWSSAYSWGNFLSSNAMVPHD